VSTGMTAIKRAQVVAGRLRVAAEAPRPDAVVGDVAPVLAGVRRLASSLPMWDGTCIVGRLDDRRRLSPGGLDDIDGVLDTHFSGPWVVLTSGAAGRVRDAAPSTVDTARFRPRRGLPVSANVWSVRLCPHAGGMGRVPTCHFGRASGWALSITTHRCAAVVRNRGA
jgi:hypothetical protein